MGLILERNDALDVNQAQQGDRHLTEGGSSWLFAVTALFLIAFLGYFALSFRPFHNERIFHYFFIIALFASTVTYFATASGLGYLVIVQHLNRGDAWTYQIFYTKYINWAISFPSIIIALGLLSGVSWATIVFNVFLTWFWVINWLVASFVASSYKWGFFFFGLLALFILAFQNMHIGRTSATRVSLSKDYLFLSGFVSAIWLVLYPIAWGVSDGGNVIGVTQSFIFFGILDLLVILGAAAGFGWFSRKWDYSKLGLAFTQHGRISQGTWPEKAGAHTATTGTTGHGITGSHHTPGTTTTGTHGHGVTGTHAPGTTAAPAAGTTSTAV